MTDNHGDAPGGHAAGILEAIFENMSHREKVELIDKLTLHAECKLRSHGPNAARYGVSAGDLVQEAFVRAFAEQRKYPPHVSVYTFFARVIDSLVWHTGHRSEHGKVHTAIASEADDEPAGVIDSHLEDRAPSVEELLLAEGNLDDFLQALSDDPELQRYVQLLAREQCSSAAESALEMGTSVNRVRAMDRRLARRRGQWQRS
jgi:DNA-directed RNA polymerase specialized sigma24 family protein